MRHHLLGALCFILSGCGGGASAISAAADGGTASDAGGTSIDATTASSGGGGAGGKGNGGTTGSSSSGGSSGSSSGSATGGGQGTDSGGARGIEDAGSSITDAGATPSTGCGTATTLTNGLAQIDVSGTTRQYILKLPDNYDPNRPYKLIFGFHWSGGSASAVASGTIIGGPYYGLQSRSAGSAILVAPDGLSVDGGPQGWPNTNGQDVAFVKAMLAQFESNLCIDKSRIFSTGFSYGGIFSLLLGCEMSDVFRAIAPMSGEFFGSCRTDGGPVAVWQAQGDADTTVPATNAQAANNYFVSKNHCSMQTTPVSPAPCLEYQGCDPGYPVTWCEFSGGHMPWNLAPDPVWAFFAQF